jgi:hypothetical protein
VSGWVLRWFMVVFVRLLGAILRVAGWGMGTGREPCWVGSGCGLAFRAARIRSAPAARWLGVGGCVGGLGSTGVLGGWATRGDEFLVELRARGRGPSGGGGGIGVGRASGAARRGVDNGVRLVGVAWIYGVVGRSGVYAWPSGFGCRLVRVDSAHGMRLLCNVHDEPEVGRGGHGVRSPGHSLGMGGQGAGYGPRGGCGALAPRPVAETVAATSVTHAPRHLVGARWGVPPNWGAPNARLASDAHAATGGDGEYYSLTNRPVRAPRFTRIPSGPDRGRRRRTRGDDGRRALRGPAAPYVRSEAPRALIRRSRSFAILLSVTRRASVETVSMEIARPFASHAPTSANIAIPFGLLVLRGGGTQAYGPHWPCNCSRVVLCESCETRQRICPGTWASLVLEDTPSRCALCARVGVGARVHRPCKVSSLRAMFVKPS